MTGGAHIGPDVVLEDPAFIHPTALIHGKVKIGKGASVWPYVVFRAEMFEIDVGEGVNIQDFAMIHVGGSTPTIIGARTSVTHRATLHGCAVGEDCLIGIGATVMDGAVIGAGSIVAGHAIVTEGAVFPENAVVAGAPAKLLKIRDNRAANRWNALFYELNGRNYARGVERLQPEDFATLQAARAR